MKKFIIALVAMFMMTFTSASAMSYEQARQQALFLTDKMAYELNLTDDQYEAAYEINLDYLMGVDTYDDLYGIYWRQRNLELHPSGLAVSLILCRKLFLPSSLLGWWILPLRHLCTLPTQRLLLLRKTSFLCCISWWTQLENEWWQKLVSRT